MNKKKGIATPKNHNTLAYIKCKFKGAYFIRSMLLLTKLFKASPFNHTILQQCQIYQLTDNLILGSIIGEDAFFLCFQFVPLLIQLIHFILSAVGISSSFLPSCFLFQVSTLLVHFIHLCLNRSNGSSTFLIFICQNFFYQLMV